MVVGILYHKVIPLVKDCLKRDDKASRAETDDVGPYESVFQLALPVGGINLEKER